MKKTPKQPASLLSRRNVVPALVSVAIVVAVTHSLSARGARSQADPGVLPAPGVVTAIVTSTFDAIAMDPRKDAVVFFYAPWCGHCQKFAPLFVELAARFADRPDLWFLKMDATRNDVPAAHRAAYPVESFPTVYFARKAAVRGAAKAPPVKFAGARHVDFLVKWVDTYNKKCTAGPMDAGQVPALIRRHAANAGQQHLLGNLNQHADKIAG
jgi:thiol-disulfide isomerase/thioredoxin